MLLLNFFGSPVHHFVVSLRDLVRMVVNILLLGKIEVHLLLSTGDLLRRRRIRLSKGLIVSLLHIVNGQRLFIKSILDWRRNSSGGIERRFLNWRHNGLVVVLLQSHELPVYLCVTFLRQIIYHLLLIHVNILRHVLHVVLCKVTLLFVKIEIVLFSFKGTGADGPDFYLLVQVFLVEVVLDLTFFYLVEGSCLQLVLKTIVRVVDLRLIH